MTRSVLGFVVGLLLAGCGQAQASPAVPDSSHFCQPGEPHPPRVPAGKSLADLDSGDPRTVRVIYFAPNDRPHATETEDQVREMALEVRTFYAEQMEARGHGPRTFTLESDSEGRVAVHRFVGERPDADYTAGAHDNALSEIRRAFDTSANIYLVFVDNSYESRAVGGRSGKVGGTASTTMDWRVAAHELGHAFGLQHDFRDDTYMMSYGYDRDQLSDCAAEVLSVHPYFNPEVPVHPGAAPSAELVSEPEYPKNATRFTLEFQLADGDGLHQLIVLGTTTRNLHPAFGFQEVRACRVLNGQVEAFVEIEIDDPTPLYSVSSGRKIHVQVIDVEGNVYHGTYNLVEASPQRLATLTGGGDVAQVAFSPDGTLLAAAPYSGEIRVWDVAARQVVNTVWGNGALGFSPDGSTLAAGFGNGTAMLYDLETNRQTYLEGHGDFISAVAFSADGSLLAVAARGGALKLWDAATLTEIATLEGHTESVTYLGFAGDDSILVSFQWGAVRVWDVASGTQRTSLVGEGITGAAMSPHTSLLAFTSRDDFIRLWDPTAEEARAVVTDLHCRSGRTLAFSADGQTLAAVSDFDNSVLMWDASTRVEIAVLGAQRVRSLAFSPDGRLMAFGSGGTVTLWDASQWTGPRPRTLAKLSGDDQEGRPGAELAEPFVVEVRDQNGDPLPGARVTFRVLSGEGYIGDRFTVADAITGPDGRARITLTLGQPGANRVTATIVGLKPAVFRALGVDTSEVPMEEFDFPTQNLPEGSVVRLGRGALPQGDRTIAFSPDGRILGVASFAGLWLYDVANPANYSGIDRAAHSVAFSPDGATVAAGHGGEISLWDLATLTQSGTIPVSHWVKYMSFSPDGGRLVHGSSAPWMDVWDFATGHTTTFEGHTSPGTSAAFSPDGRLLASAEEDGIIRLWDAATGVQLEVLEGNGAHVGSVSFSSDGTTLASASSDGTVGLWDVATGARIGSLVGHESTVVCVAFAPRGNLLASGGHNGTLRVWDTSSQRSVVPLSGHEGLVIAVSFSPDGRALASVSEEGTIGLWDLATGNATIISGHTDSFNAMAFSPDGSTLATDAHSWDGRVLLWDTETGREIVTLASPTDVIRNIAFSPDGKTLAVTSQDRKVTLWDLEAYAVSDVFRTEDFRISDLLYSPDGRILAVAERRRVALWDLGTGQVTASLAPGFSGWVSSLAFSPGGSRMAVGSDLGDVLIWDPEADTTSALQGEANTSGQRGSWDRVLSLSFSPDGTDLTAIWNPNGQYELIRWDLGTGAVVLSRTQDYARAIAMAPDGQTFATGSHDGVVRLWDMSRRRPLATRQGHFMEVLLMEYSRDGSMLASAARDGLVVVWDLEQLRPHARALKALAGQEQKAGPGAVLQPFVVEVRDQNGEFFRGAVVTFQVLGGGTLTTVRDTTSILGRAATVLTLGLEIGTYSVVASVPGLDPVTFTARAKAVPDFDGDGVTGLEDFWLFVEAFGGSDPRFDLDESGSVDFADFFLFAESFGQLARARLLALAKESIGLPEEPGLQQNAPNPFNSQTVIAWLQLEPGPARLEVFTLGGQRVAVLHDEPRLAGLHRLLWDGRDDQDRPLASGVYFYRLAVAGSVQTRKLTLLR